MIEMQPKHIAWIFDAAGEHFQKEIERLETELVRHSQLIKEPLVTMRSAQPTRQDRIEEIQNFLDQYKAIVLFCKAGKDKAVDLSAAQFAQQFAGMFKKKTN